jgi:glyoxylase-like metal-dependent hydrolase (beta-lactamase superfamily II)/rhodanese-related sulfurtransferase
MMSLKAYKAIDLFQWIKSNDQDYFLLDVRSESDFGRFKVEGPNPVRMKNVPYIDFSDEEEEESVAQVPRDKKIKVVCAKEGSARFVGEVLINHGFKDVAYLEGGIKTWGNLLVPMRVDQGTSDYQLYQFVRPAKASCSYGLIYKDEMMIFDPTKESDFYRSFASENGCRIVRTFETHLQADYISGSPAIARETGADLMANENDFNGAAFSYQAVQDLAVYHFSDGGAAVKVVHTPGHTPGSTSYVIDDRYMISGDTVFLVSIGRPDLGGKVEEWSRHLFDTLGNKVGQMDPKLVVLPGHFMSWEEADADLIFQDTLDAIKEKNRTIFDIESPDQFVQFIKDNMREQPEVYAKIRQVNAGRLDVDLDEQNIMDLGKNECAASAAQK